MKIKCLCGKMITDNTNALPHKARFIADQDHFDFQETLDWGFQREMYQCDGCGRLWLYDQEDNLRSFKPDDDGSRAVLGSILGSTRGEAYPAALSAGWHDWKTPPEGDIFWPSSGARPGGFEVHKDRAVFEARYHEVFKQLQQEGRLRSAVMHEGEKKLHEWPDKPEPKLPEDGILWRGWNEETIGLIKEKSRPFLVFVTDPRPDVAPSLKKLLKALPENPALRELLKEQVSVLLTHSAAPEPFKSLGAGETFHVAVFAPTGTPLVTFKLAGETSALVDEIVLVLEKLRETWV